MRRQIVLLPMAIIILVHASSHVWIQNICFPYQTSRASSKPAGLALTKRRTPCLMICHKMLFVGSRSTMPWRGHFFWWDSSGNNACRRASYVMRHTRSVLVVRNSGLSRHHIANLEIDDTHIYIYICNLHWMFTYSNTGVCFGG